MRTLFLFLLAAVMFSCTSQEHNLKGRISKLDVSSTMVFLCDAENYSLLDSVSVEGDRFYFNTTDSIPVVRVLLLKDPSNGNLILTLPVVLGDGNVKVILGEKVVTYGTPLNDSMQDFLLALDGFNEKAQKMNKEEFRNSFKEFLKAQILTNRNNIVGQFLLNSYSDRFSPEEKVEITGQMKN